MNTPKVSAVIPCLNEAATLRMCIIKAQQAFSELGIIGEVIVGDNNSTDGSIAIAIEAGARVAHQPIRGYGAAISAAVTIAKGNYIIMADADDSYDWSQLQPFIEKLDQGFDLVMGNRFKGTIHPGAMPFLHRYVGNPVLSGIARFLYRSDVGDFHCGMRGFTRAAWDKMQLETNGMEFATEMVVRASHEGLKITEVAIDLFPDKRTHPPHLKAFRDGWRHLRFIMTYAPNHLYLLPGCILFCMGIILQFALVNGPIHIAGYFVGIHFLALGMLFTLVGLNILSIGAIAKLFLVNRSAAIHDKLAIWLHNHYTLERSLVLGALLCVLGISIDVNLLTKWLRLGGPMTDTIHLAFVATGIIAVGIHIIFISFLLSMLLKK